MRYEILRSVNKENKWPNLELNKELNYMREVKFLKKDKIGFLEEMMKIFWPIFL